MMNRVLNGTKEPREWERLVAVMKAAMRGAGVEAAAREALERFVRLQEERGAT